MKYVYYLVACLLVTACGTSHSDNSKDNEVKIVEVLVSEYEIIPDSCNVTWERYLHQKPTKQNVQMFGAQVEVDLGEVEMTTSGTVKVTAGFLRYRDNLPIDAQLIFDVESFKLSKEKGQGLFDVKKYPNCTLDLEFEQIDNGGLHTDAKLTIQDTTKELEVDFSFSLKSEMVRMNGEFPINTLDFPLREKVKAEDVHKDVITITVDVLYKLMSERKDTVR
jgi:hypothetical protein